MSKENVTRITPAHSGQSIKPDRVVQKSDSSGNTHTYYSEQGSKAHGHSVQDSKGDIVYARTMGGRKVSK